jgi:hypothetical protein
MNLIADKKTSQKPAEQEHEKILKSKQKKRKVSLFLNKNFVI